MIHLHATKKLLNTSRIEAFLHISEPEKGQLLHSWYCGLLATGFQGKLLVMYVHEPSLMTIVCRGKTVKGTWPEFRQRLPILLEKFAFDPALIKSEMELANEYVVSKTNSRRMLGYMNAMTDQLEFMCSRFDRYEDIALDIMEEQMMRWPYQDPNKKGISFTFPTSYWKDRLARQ